MGAAKRDEPGGTMPDGISISGGGKGNPPPGRPFTPPYPVPRPALIGLLRAMLQGDGDLLGLMPAAAYSSPIGPLGYSRRSIVIVNDPKLVRQVLVDEDQILPKSDLMVNALDPLIGDSIFVSSGATWRRQRSMMDPALSLMRVNRAFASMAAGADAAETLLAERSASGAEFSLDLFMSHMTADIICRSVFSTTLEADAAHRVFDAFTFFERAVAQVEIRRLIMDRAWTRIPQSQAVLDSCATIRDCLGQLLDRHLAAGARFDDIAAGVVAATDGEGRAFTRKELIDQLGVLFLAGHETSASALTWAFLLLAMRPDLVARLRAEVAEVCGDGPITFEHTRRLVFVRNIFQETLRLYPPITFLPRVANEDMRIGSYRVKKGALVMVVPWILHRHRSYWRDPNVFDPDRFTPERKAEMVSGAYIPFGLGPRICAGANFATVEAVLLIARLFRRFDLTLSDPGAIRPAARLTTRPARQVMVRVRAA